MKSSNPTTKRQQLFMKTKGLTLGRRLSNKTKFGDLESSRNPKSGDSLRLDGYGGEVSLSDGQLVTLQTLVNISVSGVVIFTCSRAQISGCKLATMPMRLFKHPVV